MHFGGVTVLIRWFMRWNGEFDDLTRPDMSSHLLYHLYVSYTLVN